MKPVDVLIAISVAIIWGMGFVIAKAGMSHFSPILLMALRFTLTAACLIYFFRPPPGLFSQLFWISLISAALQYSLTFNGVRGIDAIIGTDLDRHPPGDLTHRCQEWKAPVGVGDGLVGDGGHA